MAQTENRLSGQNHKNAYSQTRKNKAIRNQITAKNVPQSRPPPQKKEVIQNKLITKTQKKT